MSAKYPNGTSCFIGGKASTDGTDANECSIVERLCSAGHAP